MSDTTPTTTNKPTEGTSPRPRIGSTSSIQNAEPNNADAAATLAISPSDYFTDDDSEEEIDQTTPRRYSTVHRQDGSFDLCGSMYKRRGGLGRNAENKWIMRCFTLYGPILCYHEESKIEEVTDPSNPRARLNLLKIETIAEMHSKQKPGLPTEHLLTVNIYSNLGKRKWEMCCTSKEQQVIWYNAINAYDGKVTRGSINVPQRSPFEDLDDVDITREAHLQMPKIGSNDRFELRPRVNSSGGLSMQEVEAVAKAAAKAAVGMSQDEFTNQQSNELSFNNKILLVVVLNAASYWIRNGSEQTYKVTLFFLNAFVLYIAFQQNGGSSQPALKGPKARAAAKKQTFAEPASTAISPTKKKKGSKLLPLGSTIPKNTSQPHSYGVTDPTMFNLRIGPNYKKNKQKAPSGPALYELHSMDFVYGDAPLKHTSDKFVIPSVPGVTDISTGHAHIPPMIIVNTWLPGEEPALFSKTADGESYSIPMVFMIKKDTLEQLKDLNSASPAVKLWSEWCRKAEHDAEFRGRFKCMGMIEDIDSTGVPKFIQGYNGKPALVTKSGGFTRFENYIEFSINVGMWVFPARKGLHALAPRFPDFIVNFGFTIEGRSDDELPEALLGGCRILNLDPDKAMVDGVDF